MSRKTISVDEGAYETLEAHKDEDESWSDVFEQAAEALESGDGSDEHEVNTAVVENIDEVKRAVADEVENRLTRR